MRVNGLWFCPCCGRPVEVADGYEIFEGAAAHFGCFASRKR